MELKDDLIKGAKGLCDHSGGLLSERAVYHLVEKGHLPAIRLGNQLYFRKSEIDKTLSALSTS